MSTTQTTTAPPVSQSAARTQALQARKRRELINAIVLYAGVVLFALVTLAPIYWIVLSAFTPITELFTTPLNYFPVHPSLINFETVAQIVPIGQQFMNSAVLSVASAFFSVTVCLMAAYAFARIRFPGSNILFFALL